MARKFDSYEISEEYYDRLLIEMRNLDAVEPDTSCTILGKEFATPIMTAAFCMLDDFRGNGTAEMAKGMKDAGALMKIEMSYNDVQGTRIARNEKALVNNETGYEMLKDKGMLFSALQRFTTMFGAIMPM